MTVQERKIREALGSFRVFTPGMKIKKKKFNKERFRKLAAEVSRIYSDESTLRSNEGIYSEM